MKKIISILTILGIAFTANSQSNYLPQNKYKANTKDYKVRGLFMGGGISSSTFLNTTFANNNAAGKISSNVGYNLSAMYQFNSLFLEGGVFYNKFNADGIKKDFNYPDNYVFAHRGGEVAINYIVIPSKSSIGFLKPYIGAGYEFGEMAILTKESLSIGEDIYSSVKTNGAYAQVGIMLMLNKSFNVNASYKRSIDSYQNDKGHTQFRVGINIGLNFSNKH